MHAHSAQSNLLSRFGKLSLKLLFLYDDCTKRQVCAKCVEGTCTKPGVNGTACALYHSSSIAVPEQEPLQDLSKPAGHVNTPPYACTTCRILPLIGIEGKNCHVGAHAKARVLH